MAASLKGFREETRTWLEEQLSGPFKALRGLKGYAGATLIGDGRMALILDVDGLRGQD